MTTFRFSRSMRLLGAFGVLIVVACAASTHGSPNPVPQSATDKAAPSGGAATAQARPALEPRAIEILKATCARLATAHSMEFTAIETFENRAVWGFPSLTPPNRTCFFSGPTNFASSPPVTVPLLSSITMAKR